LIPEFPYTRDGWYGLKDIYMIIYEAKNAGHPYILQEDYLCSNRSSDYFDSAFARWTWLNDISFLMLDSNYVVLN
jgi:hypothetical protein